MKAFNTLIIIGTAALQVACAGYSQRVYEVPLESTKNTDFVSLKDVRPEQEKYFSFRSRLATDCEFAIAELGDSNTNPSRMDILKSELNREQNSQLNGKLIEVEHFKIIDNRQMSLRRASSFAGPVLIDSLCKAGTNVEGGVDQNENPEYLPQLTFLISAKINGNAVSAKQVKIYKGDDGRASAIKDGLLALTKTFKESLTK